MDGTFEFNDQWSFTAGARFTKDEKDFKKLTGNGAPCNQYTPLQDQVIQPDGSCFDPLSTRISRSGLTSATAPNHGQILPDEQYFLNIQASEEWDEVTWRLGVDHFINDDHFLYGFVATGYRSGGFNLMSPRATTDVDTVKPESLTSYEIGYKGTLWDGRVNLTSALYYYDYEDLQVLKSDVIEGVTLSVYENAAEAEAWGLETEITALLTQGLTFSASWSYNDSEYNDFESADTNACAIGPLREVNSQHLPCIGQVGR